MAKGMRPKTPSRDTGAKQPPGRGGPAASAPPRASKTRLYLLLALLFCVSALLVAKWVYDHHANALPQIPTPTLAGVDPEIADEITKAREMVVKEPRSPKTWAHLAYLFDMYLFSDEAIVCYQAAEILEPSNWAWPYLRAALLVKSAQPENALPCLERAAELAPLPAARLKLADFLMSLGRVDSAEQHYRRVLAAEAKNVQALFGLAQVANAREDFQGALENLKKVADDPYLRKRACALRAAACERLGDHDAAARERSLFARLPEDAPRPDVQWQFQDLRKGVRGRILRAQGLQSQGKTSDAVALLADTVSRFPQSDQAWVALAVAKGTAGDAAGAEQAFRKSIELAPNRVDFHSALGDFLQARKRYKEAVSVFRRAIELSPVDAKNQLRLGDALSAAGDSANAKLAYRTAAQLNPELTEAREKLTQLEKK